MKIRNFLAASAASTVFLTGCASFSADGGFGKVSALTKERTGQAVAAQRTDADGQAARARVTELLKEPLTAESAVEVALLNNRGLQAKFGELGIAESDLVRAGRLKNPSFSFGRLSGGGSVETDRAVLFDVLGLLMERVAKKPLDQILKEMLFDPLGTGSSSRLEAILPRADARAIEAAASTLRLYRRGEPLMIMPNVFVR